MRLLWFLAGLCVFCNASAQTVSLSGNVLDENGNGLPGVYLVAVHPETSDVLAAAASDDDGKYVLASVPLHFILNVTRLGYTGQNIPVDGETDMDAVMTIRMQGLWREG